MPRPSWDEYWMAMANLVATRATCNRKHVGAVIVKANRIISTGYNGAPAGLPHCDDVDHEMKDIDGRPSCIRTLHAESNALDQAGPAASGGTLYATVTPCYECAKRIINSGIVRVVYGEWYNSRNTDLVRSLFDTAGVKMEQWKPVRMRCSIDGCGKGADLPYSTCVEHHTPEATLSKLHATR